MSADHASAWDTQTEDRTGCDRRASDRRAPRRGFDTMFVATLVNQIAPAETDYVRGYCAQPTSLRCGVMVNFRA